MSTSLYNSIADDGFFLLGYLQVPDFAPLVIQQSNPKTYDPYLILPERCATLHKGDNGIIPPTTAPIARRDIVGLTSLESKPMYLRQHMQNHNQHVAEFHHQVKLGNPSAIQIQRNRKALYHAWNNERRLAVGLPRDDDPDLEDYELFPDKPPFEPRVEATVSAWSGLFIDDDDDDDDNGDMMKLERAAKIVQAEAKETKILSHNSWMLQDELKEIVKVQERVLSRIQDETDKQAKAQERWQEIQAHRLTKCVTHNGWPCDINTIWDWHGNYKDGGMYSHPVILGFRQGRAALANPAQGHVAPVTPA